MKVSISRVISSLCCTLLISFSLYANKSVAPKFIIRSQGLNAARRMAGSVDHIMLPGMDKDYTNLSFTPEYTRSFYPKRIAECLFGNALCDRTLKIQGSTVTDRDDNALLADYFYLAPDFSSEVTLTPRIQNFLVDVNYYLGLDHWLEGLYIWLQAPLTWTKWDLHVCETVKETGTQGYAAGYFTPNELDRSELLDKFTDYAQGNSPGTIEQTVTANDEDFEIIFNPLHCAKFPACNKSKTTISELRLALGWNFFLEEDYHFGINAQASIPTGNEVKPEYLFAPQNGNDDHWELGIGLNGHYTFWRSEEENRSLSLYVNADISHMFKKHQARTFDLRKKPLSRYMLAEKLGVPVEKGLMGDIGVSTLVAPSAQFKNEYTPVANLTTVDVIVQIPVQADFVAMLNYTHNEKWNCDIGYNLWARTCERICFKEGCISELDSDIWALKGDAHVYGFAESTGGGITTGEAVPLSATESNATIYSGKNYPDNTIATARTNPQIDNSRPAQAAGNVLASTPDAVDQINTSMNPVFLKKIS